MLVNIVFPSGLTSARAELFNYGWMTLVVMFIILVIGAIVYFTHRPHARHREHVPQPSQVGTHVQ
jgi:heme/copper-type cytochrome/quinol oxidase subunit 2